MVMERLVMTRRHWQAMRRHVARRAPLEACGLLAGKNDKVEMTLGVRNADRSPLRFRMEARAQWRAFRRIEDLGLELVGIYHSHPNGPQHPSPTEVAEAMYPVVQVVWSPQEGKWQARGFWIEGGMFSEIDLQVINPE
jgi:proteasome lid subunit RPN8/RPN11